ncbi:MAG: hypothetical protein ABGZ37_02150 [Akkermansiaceae bacterium]
MKLQYLIPTLAAAGLVMPPAMGQEVDPFGGSPNPNRKPTREELYESLPKLIQVQVEWIAMDHATATDLLFLRDPKGDSTPLRKEVQDLVKEGKAEVIETAICLARPGQKATTESNREHIYPTEYEPPEIPNEVQIDGKGEAAALAQLITPATPTAFETRLVGTTLEIEPNIGADSRIIDVRFSPEIVYHTGEAMWESAKDSLGNEDNIRMPLFYSLRTSTGLTVRDGQYRFVGLLSPKGEDGESDRARKVMMFLKCDLIAIGEEDLPPVDEKKEG